MRTRESRNKLSFQNIFIKSRNQKNSLKENNSKINENKIKSKEINSEDEEINKKVYQKSNKKRENKFGSKTNNESNLNQQKTDLEIQDEKRNSEACSEETQIFKDGDSPFINQNTRKNNFDRQKGVTIYIRQAGSRQKSENEKSRVRGWLIGRQRNSDSTESEILEKQATKANSCKKRQAQDSEIVSFEFQEAEFFFEEPSHF